MPSMHLELVQHPLLQPTSLKLQASAVSDVLLRFSSLVRKTFFALLLAVEAVEAVSSKAVPSRHKTGTQRHKTLIFGYILVATSGDQNPM